MNYRNDSAKQSAYNIEPNDSDKYDPEVFVELLKAIKPENLVILHENYTQRFINDNQRIWQVGAIFIPLSLSGFLVYLNVVVKNDQPNRLIYLFLLATFSILVMYLWLVVSENQRAYQNSQKEWIHSIEEAMGLSNVPSSKIPDNDINRNYIVDAAIQNVRHMLWKSIYCGWIILFYAELDVLIPDIGFYVPYVLLLVASIYIFGPNLIWKIRSTQL